MPLSKFLGVLIHAAVLSGAALGADPSPVKMLVSAANRGRDDPAIHNGTAEVDEEIKKPRADDAERKIAEDELKMLRASIAQQTDPVQKEKLAELTERQEKSWSETKDKPRTVRSRWRVVFDGSRPAGQLRYEVHRGFRPDKHLHPEALVTLGTREPSGGFLTVTQSSAKNVQVRAEPFWDIPWFPDFGSEPEGREFFFTTSATATVTQSPRLIKKETIDGHELAVIEAVSSAGTKRVLWIDPARGYVCPRIESYDTAGRLTATSEGSGYFAEASSGVWFAGRYVKTLFDPASGEQTRQTKWNVDRSTVKINYAIPADEFSMPITNATFVFDDRPGGRAWQAMQSTRLGIADGSLDLDHTPGLKALTQARWTSGWPTSFSTMAKWIIAAVAVVVTIVLAGAVWFLKLVITRTRLVD